MGDSVSIRWEDGATGAEVRAISGKYQYGHFDGMTDMYEYSNRRDDIPQSKYVSDSRDMSEQTKAVRAQFIENFEGDKHGHWGAEQIFYRVFAKTSIPAGAKVVGIVRDNEANETDYYSLVLDLSEAKEVAPVKPEAVEVQPGTVQVIEYGERAIAVIGDTKPIKEKLKELGGKFNPRLTCGAGWIFPRKRLDEITSALSKKTEDSPTPQPEPPKTDESKKEERAPVTMVPEVKIYDNLQDIENAANNGEVISLLNLAELVNKKTGS